LIFLFSSQLAEFLSIDIIIHAFFTPVFTFLEAFVRTMFS